ncbi:hypothetical protein Tco_1201099 [Tanacetum coccineum]
MRDIVRLKTERELVRVKIHDGNAFWNEIGVNAGVSKLMLLSLNLLLPVLVNAAKLKLTAASINLKGEVEEDLMFDTGVLNGNEEMFDKEMKNTELVKGSKTKAEGSSKRAGEELESDNLKK